MADQSAPMSDDRLYDSLDVYAAEWRLIESRRSGIALPADEFPLGPPAPVQPPPPGLTGFALSGGGIRSATFNLGVLQAFSRGGLLRDVDYLSTVSGGGYMGGWWSAWLARARRGTDGPGFPPAEGTEPLRYGGAPAAPDPVHHVRLFSNYLTPRKGAMSPDFWRAVTVIGRNLALTWLVLVPILAIPILLAQALFAWNYYPGAARDLFTPGIEDFGGRVRNAMELPVEFLAAFALLSIVWLMVQRGAVLWQRVIAIVSLTTVGTLIYRALPASPPSWAPLICILALAVMALRIWFPLSRPDEGKVLWEDDAGPVYRSRGSSRDKTLNRVSRLQGVALVGALVTAAVTLVAGFGHELVSYVFFTEHRGAFESIAVQIGKYGTLIATAVSTIHAGVAGAPAGGAESAQRSRSPVSRILLAIAPPLLMFVLLLAVSWLGASSVVAAGNDIGAWARLTREITLIGLVAMVLFAVLEEDAASIRIPVVLLLAVAGAAFWDDMRGQVSVASYLGIAGSIAAGLFVASRGVRKPGSVTRAGWLVLAASVVATAVTLLGAHVVNPPESVHLLLGTAGALGTAVLLLGWTSDPNTLSLHNFYKSRLVRAYLGASNPARARADAEDVTEAKDGDDLPLWSISGTGSDAPYHLINGTLNLTAGSDLVIAQRAAAPFLFSRLFCGSARTGFRNTETYRSGTLSLGTAIAISGAAASPVMGSQTPKTAVSMLMALLNVRLGYWLPTPSGSDWRAPQARFWPVYLLREFFSHTADTGRYCYVTDGGHFDNTGAYPLIERGCRVIVLTDCGADPDCVFDDLANLVRRCRIDFGTQITFDLHPFSRETMANDRRHFVVGSIVYSPAHLRALGFRDGEPGLEGTLIVVKPTLVASLETDVTRYSQVNATFPQQSTADQWFDEAQFESYRRLGERSGNAAADVVATHLAAAHTVAT